MRRNRDVSLNEGCLNCGNYIGMQPVNVPNFRCSADVENFKVYFCSKFEGRARAPNTKSDEAEPLK